VRAAGSRRGIALSARAELPLDPRSLDERCSVAGVSPGVWWTRIVRDGGPWRVAHCVALDGMDLFLGSG
jgi:hypothetical protein